MNVCPNCGHENETAAKFCSQCATPLAEVSLDAGTERKVITVLFADLVGFTSKAERLDPEDVQAMLHPYHTRLRFELERWGGTVEKFIGDAVVALFGAPVARENDPERAVRAALAIRDWIVEEGELQVRIGVNTGEALVNLAARPDAGEGMAAGDVVNTAARLQAAAPTNGILAGETTYRGTEATIDYREHDPVTAKGKVGPVAVWEVVQARARFGVDLAPKTRTPLVGRERELDMLVATLQRARQQRSTELLTLVGVPGIGKSRLVGELFHWIEGSGRLTYWRQGRSLPYGEGVSYWALAEMVKAQAGILETDPDDEVEAKLAAPSSNSSTTTRSGCFLISDRSSARPVTPQRAHKRRRSLRGGGSSRRWRSVTRSCWSSRTSSGRTTVCSTSSSISPTGPPTSRS